MYAILSVMGKFKIINYAYALCLFQILSTVQQTRASLLLSLRKIASCRHPFLQKF